MLYTKAPYKANTWAQMHSMFTGNVNIQTGATPHTYGDWTEICSGLDIPGYHMSFNSVNTLAASTFNRSLYADIGFGPDSGNVEVIVPYLGISHTAGYAGTTVRGPSRYEIPLYIPPDTKIWCRAQSNIALQNVEVLTNIECGERDPGSNPLVYKYEVIGVQPDTANTQGSVSVTFATANNAPGTVAAVTNASSNAYIGAIVSGFFTTGATHAAQNYAADLVIFGDDGDGNTKEVVVGRHCLMEMQSVTEQAVRFSNPVFAHMPEGIGIGVRGNRPLTGGFASMSFIILGMIGQ